MTTKNAGVLLFQNEQMPLISVQRFNDSNVQRFNGSTLGSHFATKCCEDVKTRDVSQKKRLSKMFVQPRRFVVVPVRAPGGSWRLLAAPGGSWCGKMGQKMGQNCARELCGVTSGILGGKMGQKMGQNCAHELCGVTSEVPGGKMGQKMGQNCAHELCGVTSATSWALIGIRPKSVHGSSCLRLPKVQGWPRIQ